MLVVSVMLQIRVSTEILARMRGKSTLQQIPWQAVNSRKLDHPSVPAIAVEVNINLTYSSSKKQNVFTVRSDDIL